MSTLAAHRMIADVAPVDDFVAARCARHNLAAADVPALFTAYQCWAAQVRLRPLSLRLFRAALLGLPDVRPAVGAVDRVAGLQLRGSE